MKASLVAYDRGELYKNSKIKIVKYGYVKNYPKRPVIQIGLLKILGIKPKVLVPYLCNVGHHVG
jgi:hypothetical protein